MENVKTGGRKNLYTTTGVKRLCETVHIPRKREEEGRVRQWRTSGRAYTYTRMHAKYARPQVYGTTERRKRGRGGARKREKRVERDAKNSSALQLVLLAWPERKQDARTGKPYVPNVKFVHGRKRVREVARDRGRGSKRTSQLHIHTYTRTHKSAHVHKGHYCQPSLGGHRAPIPSTAIEICRKCAANTRVSLENFFDLLYRPRNLSSNSPVVSNPGIRSFVPLHFFWKVEKFFLWGEWKESLFEFVN